MTVHRISNPKRLNDDWGSGSFAASRGGRYHKGRDYLFEPGEEVRSPVEGTVLRLGYPYNDSDSTERYRLVEILGSGRRVIWRFFYVRPCVAVGEMVFPAQMIGVAQDIAKKYKDPQRQHMGNHVHVECIVDPEAFFDNAHQTEIGGQLWA